MSALEYRRSVRALLLILLIITGISGLAAQAPSQDTLEGRRIKAEQAKLVLPLDSCILTIQNVSLTNFPQIDLIVECEGKCYVLDTINPSRLKVIENGVERKVTAIRKVSIQERVAVDFVFVIDITGTMQPYINATRNNVASFAKKLKERGIDFRLGLVEFSDIVERMYEPTDSIEKFLGWMNRIVAEGGFDEKENALEGLSEASKLKLRPEANKVCIVVSDAGYHQSGEKGMGRTKFTTNSMVTHLQKLGIRLFCITPPSLQSYKDLSADLRGGTFDINKPFDKILASYGDRFSNLYTIAYQGNSKIVSDSINVSILDEHKRELVKQIIPIVEIGRKFIIENLLFPTGSATLPDTVSELDVLIEFMNSRPQVSIKVEGHTDNTGSPKTNTMLSRARADAVKLYLINHKIDEKRIEALGLGPKRPIADNNTEFGRRLNRRTEIVITGK